MKLYFVTNLGHTYKTVDLSQFNISSQYFEVVYRYYSANEEPVSCFISKENPSVK